MSVNPTDKKRTPLSGLSSAEALQRLAVDGPNLLPDAKPKSTAKIVLGVVAEPMFLMLLVAGGIYFALGDTAEAIFLLASVVAVIGISLAQEHRAQRAIESLRDMSAPQARVLRDGCELSLPTRNLVREDLMVVREGDRIAADAVLIQGALKVNESMLTGESVPVDKLSCPDEAATVIPSPDAEKYALFAGTLVTGGEGIARVSVTGGATMVGQIGRSLNATLEPTSYLLQSSRNLVRVLAIVAVLLALTLCGIEFWWNGQGLLESLLAGIALAMGILPEEIPVIFTVFLAMGAWRIARIKVLTKRMSAVETLGSITVLAVDKTGTLTQNQMSVVELVAPDVNGQLTNIFSSHTANVFPDRFHQLAELAMLASPESAYDPMEIAINRFNQQWLEGTHRTRAGRMPVFEFGLSPEILATTKIYARKLDSSRPEHFPVYDLATKGAPETIAELCHLAPAQREMIRLQIESMAQKGLRVLGVAYAEWSSTTEKILWPNHQDFDFKFAGLIGLADPPRAEVPAAIAECRLAGVRVIMMTGDHPATARAIAGQVGLSERPHVITGAEISALDDTALFEQLNNVDICARLKPAHKHRLVNLLQRAGHVVAMTGDGVNDAPALKAADVGIAMGLRGTDVAREAAALVLLDDSFASIVDALRQGRRIYDNISKATRFVFAVHVPVILLIMLPPIFHWPALLLPVHIVLFELLIDPACSILFEAEPEAKDIMMRKPRSLQSTPFEIQHLGRGILQGFGVSLVLVASYAWMQANNWNVGQSRSLIFCGLVVNIFLLILMNRERSGFSSIAFDNPWLSRALVGLACFFSALILLPGARKILSLGPLDKSGIFLLAIVLVVCYCWLELLRRWTFLRQS